MHTRLAVCTVALLIAAALRILGISVQSLRGDEAFAARYWTLPLAELTAPSGLAWREPHPFGAFIAFGAWRTLAGEREVALRMLPALVNLLGAAAVYATARRLFRSKHATQAGIWALLLWACNPYLIWHSQDVRNYALWSGVSALALYLLIRATDRRTWYDWTLYTLAEIVALYLFFLESFILALHALYVLMVKRRALRAWLVAFCAILAAHIPSFVQGAALAQSGYGGTRGSADLALLPNFWTVLLLGELSAPTFGAAVLILLLFSALLLPTNLRLYFILSLSLPLLALYLVATRLNVFDPRYILAALPFGTLILARMASQVRLPFSVLIGVAMIGVQLAALAPYRAESYQKAPNWRGWAAFLHQHTAAGDTLIITPADPASGATDPAIAYYYAQPARVLVLPYPNADTESFVREALLTSRAVWFTPTGSEGREVLAALERHGILQGKFDVAQNFRVWRFAKR
ncbi:MAG: glycosyltransferase family 39 protein [Anaerolineae bacterium]|nr:glycosyltransferase family 39 protein [Anaerolineae bacterium]